MRFSHLLASTALFTLSLLSGTALADTFTYSVSDHFATFRVDGTITTDNNGGTLSAADILDFSLLVSGGGQSDLLTAANVDNFGILGDALTATASGLFFDYDSLASAIYIQNSVTQTALCYQTAYCDTANQDPHESAYIYGRAVGSESQSGQVQIASFAYATAVTPEPSSLLLLATGAFAAVVIARRQQI